MSFKTWLLQERIGAVEDRNDDSEYKEFRSIVDEFVDLFMIRARMIKPFSDIDGDGLHLRNLEIDLNGSKNHSLITFHPDVYDHKSPVLNFKITCVHSVGGEGKTINSKPLPEQIVMYRIGNQPTKAKSLQSILDRFAKNGTIGKLHVNEDGDPDNEFTIEITAFTGSDMFSSTSNLKDVFSKIKGDYSPLKTLREELYHYTQILLGLNSKSNTPKDRFLYRSSPFEIGPKIHEVIRDLEENVEHHLSGLGERTKKDIIMIGRYGDETEPLYDAIDTLLNLSYDTLKEKGIELTKFPFNKQLEIIRMIYNEYIEPLIMEIIIMTEEELENNDQYSDILKGLERFQEKMGFEDILNSDIHAITSLKSGFQY